MEDGEETVLRSLVEFMAEYPGQTVLVTMTALKPDEGIFFTEYLCKLNPQPPEELRRKVVEAIHESLTHSILTSFKETETYGKH